MNEVSVDSVRGWAMKFINRHIIQDVFFVCVEIFVWKELSNLFLTKKLVKNT